MWSFIAMRTLLLLMTFVSVFWTSGDALYLAGRLHTKKSWEFVGRFCFLSDLGKLQFHFVYPLDECCLNLLFYYDEGGQWSSVYQNDSKNCFEKESVLQPADHQIINLTTKYQWSGCEVINKTGVESFECSGGRSFKTLRERWWYIALSNCPAGTQGRSIDVDYEMELTNGYSFWTKHFSADEFGILETKIAFLVIYALMFTNASRVAIELANRQMLHTTYKLFISCLGIETFGLLLYCVALGTFASDGIGNNKIRITGEVFGAVAELGFLLMLLLLGKGYTITRGQLSHSGSMKLAVFATIYAVISIVLFMYEYVLFDSGLVLYVYESPAGYGLITLRMTAWLWFTYGIIFTVKHYPEKTGFYYPFYFFYSIWFFTVPIMVLVASFAIPKYMRSRVVTALELCIDFMAYVIFLLLTRPGAANVNFPYHVRTSQIGIVKPDGKVETMGDFPHSVYGSTDMGMNGNRATNFAELFVVQAPLQNGSCSLRSSTDNNGHERKNGGCEISRVNYQQYGNRSETTRTVSAPLYEEILEENPNTNIAPIQLFAAKTGTKEQT